MFKKLQKSSTIYCFSPPVMLATIAIETALLVYVLIRFSVRSVRTQLIAVSLLCLAVFQLAEYNVCGALGVDAVWWSRLGFIVITLLPVLGVHLAIALAGRVSKLWNIVLGLAYATALSWVVIFGFTERAFTSHACGGNYVIFYLKSPYDTLYLAFYGAWLLVAIGLAMYNMHTGVSKVRRRALEYLVIGYLLFILPTTIVMGINPEAIQGLPSIMCGFAVLYALILAVGIAPLEKRIAREKPLKNKKSGLNK